MNYCIPIGKLIALICLLSFNISAQTNKTFFLGHSLTNFDIPNMVDKFSIESSLTFSYDAHIGIGANLFWHWEHPETGQGSRWDLTLPEGGYEKFIITEAVPLENHLQYSNTYRYADSLYQYANQYSPGVQYYIYETWHCIKSGDGTTTGEGGYPCSWDPNSNTPWRERLDVDLPRWESIADSINLIHDNAMLVIPAGQALGRLADSIQLGVVPGLTSVFDLFTDEHHLDSRGNYFIACVMYAVIHEHSPVGLPNQLTGPFGNLYTEYPTEAQATIMQEIAWQTVCDYQRDGVDCGIVSVSEEVNPQHQLRLFPNPAQDFVFAEYTLSKEATPFLVYDQLGKVVLTGQLDSDNTQINVEALPSGIYFFTVQNQSKKFVK